MKYLHLIFPLLAITALVALAGVAGVSYGVTQVRTIPNAAAFEANLVCSQFAGLSSFTVNDLGKNADARRYRITATCNSGHTVTNIIGVK